jgi:diadenylate cyclase
MFDVIKSMRWQDIADILIVAFVIYQVILLIRGTRAVQMLVGIAVLIVVYFGARELEFMTLYWLLGTFLSSIFLIIIIIFQRDIRRALMQMGQTPFSKGITESLQVIEEIIAAAMEMSRKRIGALIVMERDTGLKDYEDSGQLVDAKVSKSLLVSLFHPSSPLHDGGVIINEDRISHAGCVMPLSKNPYIGKNLGTRHRAAIGISEDTDAISVVVSEETGSISLAQHGAITSNLDENGLRNRLTAIFAPRESKTLLWKNWLNRS